MPSTLAGYITPNGSPAPLEDTALEDFLHDVFQGLTGMANESIRPRWQPEPPNQKDLADDWLAFGIMRFDADQNSSMVHIPNDDGGIDQQQRHETIEVLLSSYGDNATRNLALLRDGLHVSQNRDALTSQGMAVLQSGEIYPAPTLVKERWLRRYDMNLMLRRQVRREYAVLSLVSAQGIIYAEGKSLLTTPFVVSPPNP